jgi:type IV secretion system protein VirB9
MNALLSALLVLSIATAANAAVTPKPGPQDPRIQTVEYNSQQVIALTVANGYELALEFAPDERIENVAIGNSTVWQVTPNKNADHLFIKPMRGAADTDMTIITDARSYSFELKSTPTVDPSMPFIVRFVYPVAITTPDPETLGQTVIYRFSGANLLKPVDMSDDGQFTSIAWAPKAPIPAVYVINAQGQEALVNGAVRDGHFMVDQVANVFIFRLGKDEAKATRQVVKVRKR